MQVNYFRSNQSRSTARTDASRVPWVNGFTLVELLVVIAIFAFMAVASARLLDGQINVVRKSQQVQSNIEYFTLFLETLNLDLLQLVNPTTTDRQAVDASNLIFYGNAKELFFVKAGWINPLDRPRSRLQRVRYVVERESEDGDYTFTRATQKTRSELAGTEPNQDAESTFKKYVLLREVKDFAFRYIDFDGEQYDEWPPTESASVTELPLGIQIILETSSFGVYEKTYAIPQYLRRQDES